MAEEVLKHNVVNEVVMVEIDAQVVQFSREYLKEIHRGSFDDARMKFEVRFYLVSILFIIFDLEVAFLFPWAIALKGLGAVGFWSMMAFLTILTIGFVYEWKKGALEWE